MLPSKIQWKLFFPEQKSSYLYNNVGGFGDFCLPLFRLDFNLLWFSSIVFSFGTIQQTVVFKTCGNASLTFFFSFHLSVSVDVVAFVLVCLWVFQNFAFVLTGTICWIFGDTPFSIVTPFCLRNWDKHIHASLLKILKKTEYVAFAGKCLKCSN